MDEDEIREFNRNMKSLKQQKSTDRLKGVLTAFGKVIPKGVHDPNKNVRNHHLYIPGRRHTGKTILFSILALLILFSQFLPFSPSRQVYAIADPDSILIDTVRVFQNLSVSGDIMFIVEYEVNYAVTPSTPTSDAFLVLVNDGAGTVFSRPLDYYGHFFSAIYLTSATGNLTWGSSPTIQVVGNPSYFPVLTEGVNQRTLVLSTQWISGTLTTSPGYLKTWLLQLANAISPSTLLSDLNLLTTLGATKFTTEIPTLRTICPTLFSTVATYPTANTTPGSTAEETSLLGNSGARLTKAMDDLGTFLHIPGALVGGFSLFLMYFVLAGRILIATGSVPGSIVLGIPFIFAGNLIGILPLSYTFMAVFLVAVIFGIVFILGRMG